jgi:hypothetical protein
MERGFLSVYFYAESVPRARRCSKGIMSSEYKVVIHILGGSLRTWPLAKEIRRRFLAPPWPACSLVAQPARLRTRGAELARHYPGMREREPFRRGYERGTVYRDVLRTARQAARGKA